MNKQGCHQRTASVVRANPTVALLSVSALVLLAFGAVMSVRQASAAPRETIAEPALLVALHRLHSTSLAPTGLGVVLDKSVVSREEQQ